MILKKLKNKYSKDFNVKLNEETENEFYDHYFRKIAEEKKLSIEDFKDPLNQRTKNSTLNNHFFGLIFESNTFYDDFMRYMERDLRTCY